jgi:hypothetical protein
MNPRRELLELIAVCVVLALLSLGGTVWDFTSGLLLAGGIDGLMMLLICLLTGGLFSLQALALARKLGWRFPVSLRHRKSAAEPSTEPAAGNPGSQK